MKYVALLLVSITFHLAIAQADESAPDPASEGFSATRSQSISALMNQKRAVDISPKAGLEELNSQAVSPWTMIQGLALVIGVFFIGVYVYKKYVLKSVKISSRRIRIIERNPVTNKTSLVLAEIDGRKFTFAIGSERVTAINVPSDNSKVSYRDEVRVLCADEILSA